jgi:hypothetical protein
VRIDARVEPGGVEPDLRRVLLQVAAAEPPLVGEQLVVKRPELALLVGAQSSFGRGTRVGMVG